MKDIILKTFGHLSLAYYIRQFIFGALISAAMIFFLWQLPNVEFSVYVFIVFNTFIYPYARFVYESIVGYIVGDNIFAFNALIYLFAKTTTMALCWSLVIFIAPFGLLYLYIYHSRCSNQSSEPTES